jgi:hypothetical protein
MTKHERRHRQTKADPSQSTEAIIHRPAQNIRTANYQYMPKKPT